MMFRKKKSKLSRQPRSYNPSSHTRQQVFSYRSSRTSTERPFDRGSKKSGPTRARVSLAARLQYGFAAVLLLLGVGYVLSLSTEAQVKVDGPQTFPREHSEYTNSITTQLKGSPLNKTKITLRSESIAENIKREFPEVKFVSIETSLLRHRPKVTLQLAEPTARLVTPSSIYVLDEEGYALFDAKVQQASFDVGSLTPIHDNSGQQIEIGKPAVTSDQIIYIREVIGQLKGKRVGIKEMRLESGGLELHVELADTNYFVKFSFLADARQSSGAYLAIRDQNITANQYVDVRIPDRAYIK